jgi:hypothetical protein
METFLSIEEFLCLKDPNCKYDTSMHQVKLWPEQLVAYYNCAKANWERFGDEGPPIGTKVIALTPGFNGEENSERTITKKVEETGGPYFVLERRAGDVDVSWARVNFWWMLFTIPELSPFHKDRGWDYRRL